ncbi:phospholipase A2 inhibitor NAI-like [Pelodytes ibericus]
MNALVGFVCLLSAVVATGSALSCIDCVKLGGSSCSGKSKICPAGSVCGSQYTSVQSGLEKAEVFVRTCILESMCTLNASITFDSGTAKLGSSCCSTENCAPKFPVLPAVSSQGNGVICPTCISDDPDSCSTEKTMECTGDETVCVFQTTKITGELNIPVDLKHYFPVALRGCATKSVCDLININLKQRDVALDVNFLCTDGSKGQRSEL